MCAELLICADCVPFESPFESRMGRLARSLTMDRVHAYTAGVLRRAAAAQRAEVARRIDGTSSVANVVTKRNLLRHVSDSTRPWIERIFLPWHGMNASVARSRPPRAPAKPFTFS